MEQVLPRQRTERDDQTGRVENVSTTRILFLCFGISMFTPSVFPGSMQNKQFPSSSCSFSFPEIHYFQDEDVRTKLTDILFCYGRENEQLLYKQVGLRCLGLGFLSLSLSRSLVSLLSHAVHSEVMYRTLCWCPARAIRRTKHLCNLT